jgi:uroporphyrinogen III methyltransferase / synthase
MAHDLKKPSPIQNEHAGTITLKPGKVILVGAGPGDPGLITLRGVEALRFAETVVYDYLANEKLLSHAPAQAEKIYVGKQGALHAMEQQDINELIYQHAAHGKRVVRLKGGDPYIFGRGSEEASYCSQRGIDIEVVPGIPAAIGAAAYAGIPLTDRRFGSVLAFVTGHEDPHKSGSSIEWEHLARGVQTIVFYMGVNNLADLMKKLIEHGRAPDTPISVIQWATLPQQRIVEGTLSTIAELVKRENITPPALSIVGMTNSLKGTLNWFDKKPLTGKRIIVTRSREQASPLIEALQLQRARTLELPVIMFASPDSWDPVDEAIARMHEYDWVIFTSVNGVDFFFGRLHKIGRDARRFSSVKVAAIGPSTAQKLAAQGIIADFQPREFTSDALFKEFELMQDCRGLKILLLRADIADKDLRERFLSHDAHVDDIVVYKTVPAPVNADQLRLFISQDGYFGVTFASSSTVRNFVDAAHNIHVKDFEKRMHAFSIGPKTSEAMRLYGIEPAVEASEHTIPGLVKAITEYYSRNPGN